MSAKPQNSINQPSDGQVESKNSHLDLQSSDTNTSIDNAEAFLQNASQPSTSFPTAFHVRKPSAAGLHLETDVHASHESIPQKVPTVSGGEVQQQQPSSVGSTSHLFPRLSHETLGATLSPASSLSSPVIASLNDVTPLPSPIAPSRSPELWKLVTRSRGNSAESTGREDLSNSLLPPSALSSSPRRRKIAQVVGGAVQSNEYHRPAARSLSEYVPDTLHNERPRVVTLPHASVQPNEELPGTGLHENHLHREQNLAAQRNHPPETILPSPPPSNQSTASSEDGDELQRNLKQLVGGLEVKTHSGGETRSWKLMRRLGRGAFSQVVLATSTTLVDKPGVPDLVAVKIVSHDQDGGLEEERMDTGVKREIEILQHISHPCLPRLYAFDDNKTYAMLVLNYCCGGDLFELASSQRSVLRPGLLQRIFAELVAAVGYLHGEYVVHRDIKLENVLFNLAWSSLMDIADPAAYPHPFITLSDLGLSKRIPRPPESPLLTHACGSADYAAPELLLQQPYDGRSTDMWALGVLLYALLEGRLPFDPIPGQRRQASSKHRIARCDWMWCEYGDENGDWVDTNGHAVEGARDIVEGTLKKVGRGRWDLEKVQNHAWVRGGIKVEGQLRIAQ